MIRPADANEVAEAWKFVMQMRHHPAALILSRQALPTLDRAQYAPASGLFKGAYVLADAPGGKPEVLLMATGSEVSLCVSAYEQLAAEGVRVRLVSMPSWEIFERQPQEYRDGVLPPSVKVRVAVEQGSTLGWAHYVGSEGTILGMRTFGASAPLKVLQEQFGFTQQKVVAAAKEQLVRTIRRPASIGQAIGRQDKDDSLPIAGHGYGQSVWLDSRDPVRDGASAVVGRPRI